MQSLTLVLCTLCVASHLVSSMPVEQSESAVQEKVPLNEQESLLTLDLTDPKQELSTRDKRTIGILRQWFPSISKLLDNVIQSVTRYLFRVIGRLVLRGGFLGGGGGGGGGGDSSSSSGSGNRRISITLPTYPPSAEDEEEEEDNSEPPTATVTEINPEDENNLAGAESQVNEVRVQYTDPEDQGFSDQDGAATGGNDGVDGVADETRDKRSGYGSSSSDGGDAEGHGTSGGGSGNFLFDIIRLVTGSSGSLSSGSSSSSSSSDGDHSEHSEAGATAEGHAEKDSGYEAGIPGPITRLFIIANRGIANLVQDLILRLAQTSERIVNFKARLITSII